AAAGTDRLIVQPVASFLFISVSPFGVDRIGKCGASAGNVSGVSRNKCGGGDEASGRQYGPVFHGFSPCWRPKASAGLGARSLRLRALGPGGRCCFKTLQVGASDRIF